VRVAARGQKCNPICEPGYQGFRTKIGQGWLACIRHDGPIRLLSRAAQNLTGVRDAHPSGAVLVIADVKPNDLSRIIGCPKRE
jgi:hypothetical protein